MSLETRKKIIKKKHFQTGGYVILTILGVIGILLLYSSIISLSNDKSLGAGIIFIVGLFFTLITIYCYILYFFNIILKPHKEVLFLRRIEQTDFYFVDKKGKRYNYDFDKSNLEEGYYTCLKTRDYIYDVLEKSHETWNPNEKNNYWLNMYTAVGNFEGILLLPIIYLALAIGIFLFIMSNGYQKLLNLTMIIVPAYVIIYDLIYKWKLKKSIIGFVDDTKMSKSYIIVKGLASAIPSSLFCIIVTSLFVNIEGVIGKVVLLPFMGCGYCSLGASIAISFQNFKLVKTFTEMYTVIFLIYWFGILLIGTIVAIIQKQYSTILFTIPFWAAGIYIIYKEFIKKK